MRRYAPLVAVGLLGTVACSGAPPAGTAAGEGFPVAVQSCDREVTIDASPQRIPTQGTEAPVFVAAAGAADRIVARNSEFNAPLGEYAPALEQRPVIGEATSTDLSREEIIAQNPDLVVNRGPGNDLPPEALSPAGTETFVVSGRCTANDSGLVADGSFEQIWADMERFGRMLGTADVAAAATRDLQERVAAVHRQAGSVGADRTAAVIIFSEGTVGTYGNQATVDSQLRALGLRNAFADQDERYFHANVETLIARDPDVLVVLYDALTEQQSRQEITQRPELAGLRAVREGRVLALHFGLAVASPLAVEGLERLAIQLREVSP